MGRKARPLDGGDLIRGIDEQIDDPVKEPQLITVNREDGAAMIKEMWGLGFVSNWGALEGRDQITLHFIDSHAHE